MKRQRCTAFVDGFHLHSIFMCKVFIIFYAIWSLEVTLCKLKNTISRLSLSLWSSTVSIQSHFLTILCVLLHLKINYTTFSSYMTAFWCVSCYLVCYVKKMNLGVMTRKLKYAQVSIYLVGSVWFRYIQSVNSKGLLWLFLWCEYFQRYVNTVNTVIYHLTPPKLITHLNYKLRPVMSIFVLKFCF